MNYELMILTKAWVIPGSAFEGKELSRKIC